MNIETIPNTYVGKEYETNFKEEIKEIEDFLKIAKQMMKSSTSTNKINLWFNGKIITLTLLECLVFYNKQKLALIELKKEEEKYRLYSLETRKGSVHYYVEKKRR